MRRAARRASKGFTLVELIIALSLSSFVLIGVMMLATTMVRQHYDSLRSGAVTTSTLFTLDAMNRDIEGATHIDPSYPTTGGGSAVAVCQNWSPTMGGSIDGQAADVKTIIYCGDGTATGSTGGNAGMDTGNNLWRYEHDGACDLPTAVTCGSSPNSGTWMQVVSGSFWPGDPGTAYANYFTRTPDGGGIIFNYIVGHSTPAVNVPTPSYFKGSYAVRVQRHIDVSAPTGND